MSRKFVQVIPFAKENEIGVWLYAVADDGTAWRARHLQDGTFDIEWEQIPQLPEIDQFAGAI